MQRCQIDMQGGITRCSSLHIPACATPCGHGQSPAAPGAGQHHTRPCEQQSLAPSSLLPLHTQPERTCKSPQPQAAHPLHITPYSGQKTQDLIRVQHVASSPHCCFTACKLSKLFKAMGIFDRSPLTNTLRTEIGHSGTWKMCQSCKCLCRFQRRWAASLWHKSRPAPLNIHIFPEQSNKPERR